MTAEAAGSSVAATSLAAASLVRPGSTGAPVVARVQLARSFWGRFKGLMGRASLDPDEGLYLPVNSIHMLFMRFAIDALFLDRPDAAGVQRVVAIRSGLRPWTGLVLPVSGAVGVVELRSGAIERAGLAVGDALRLQEPPATVSRSAPG
jgi:uncharacterized membrane protein (UPF0127 family)